MSGPPQLWTPLARLLVDADPARPVVAGAEGIADWARLAARAGGVARRLEALPDGPVALLCADGGECAAALLGTLAAGREAVLPPHPAALAGLGAVGTIDAAWLAATPLAEPLRAEVGGSVSFFTSGSTGTPRLVRRGLAGLQAELDSFRAQWGAAAAGRVISTVSRRHLYGLTFSLLWPLAAGGVVLAETLQTWESVWPHLAADTVLVSSPAHLTRMAGLAPLAAPPRLVLSAGAPLPAAAAGEAAVLLGRAVDEVFGSTETGAIATRQCAPNWHEGDEAPWRPLPGVAARVGEDGRLELASPALECPGWRLTADRAAVVEGGFRFLGRADRVAKIEGKRVDLAALEAALVAGGGVAEAAVFPLSGKREVLVAAVVPDAAGAAELAASGAFRFGRALRARLTGQLEAAGLPRRWRFVSTLPKTRLGKPDPAALRALFDAP